VRSQQEYERPVKAPIPADLRHLQPQDARGIWLVLLCLALTASGIRLSLLPGLVPWVLGQVLTAGALLHWFVLLHECGHETLFKSRRWHRIVGPVAGALSLIPFASWTRVHARHHKWTGWQDLDPTTVALVPKERSRASRALVNICWRLWIPLFSCVYRIENYWHLPRLNRLFSAPRERRAIRNGIITILAIYTVVAFLAGVETCVRVAGLAILLSFGVEDVLLLSQHTHVPQHVSHAAQLRCPRAPPHVSLRAWLSPSRDRLPAPARDRVVAVDA
jgi:omega-6 fatty acid desaturase (delta-12 desaturase)